MSDNPFDTVELQKRSVSPHHDNSPSYEFCTKSIEETVAQLRTDPVNGLCSSQDVTQRRGLHGMNELSAEEEESLLWKFLETFYQDPLILLLIGSAVISFLMGNIDDSVSITLAIFIVVSVGFVQEYRSEQSLQALNKLVPAEAHLIRNGSTQNILASQLVPGDLVHFSVGDRIPADIRLVEAVHLTVDESNLTGETEPVHKLTEAVEPQGLGIPLNERHCIAYMGTLVRDGHGTGLVVATGHDTAFGAVFEMMSDIEKPKTPLQNSMDKLGKDLSVVSFAVIGFICIIGVFQGRSWLEMFQVSVSLAVAAIPEGLPIIVTVTLALGVLRMARQKAIVRRLPSVETLGSVNVICSDKTGTLTQNHMTVKHLWTTDMNTEVLDISKHTHSTLTQYLTDDVKQTLEAASICNNAKYSQEGAKFIGNPTDIALLEVLPEFKMEDMRSSRSRTKEVPFSSTKKYMAVTVHLGDKSKSSTYVKGAVEKVLARSTSYLTRDGKTETLNESTSKKILTAADKMASHGLRVLAFGYNNKDFDDEPSGLTFVGLIGMKDPPRPTVKGAIAKLMKGGVHVIMITGDAEATAVEIAREIGMPITDVSRNVISGDKLDEMDEASLAEVISSVCVFARTTPEHKVQIVRALQRRGDVVAMTGDGVNDAPALKLADIGIAMGKMGTDVAKEAADMVLTDDDFSTILSAIEEGKGIFNNIQNFLTFQLSTSVAALSLIAFATFLKLPNPLNAMQILWINILMDGPPAQSLGVEPVDSEVMNKPPRQRGAKILTEAVLRRLLMNALFVIAGTIFVYVREMEDNQITHRDTTMTFTCFVLFDMFNALSCRHATKSVFEIGFSNQMFNFAVLGSLAGQLCAIYVPFFQSIFQTEALSLGDLVFLSVVSSSVFIFDECRKYFTKQQQRTTFNSIV
ncbi:Ca(2+)/Mn(2+)-transporting P-type ATPase PMR1 [Cyberlindnera jadinii NRRL Y-1542]|uniref:Calcium-transporting ATPase n=1 Tax=Cyberlindnera jadinii (strain ATCC 18201 / CBS 1600 / BCRC 20928 / JCM 3617 / NBRC 0987 / NRRL Y-1542) TaxID=983966 RepID=A0A1E4RXL2_CYBJN|nr:calcium-transporting P [Cyberlindnera jadinii NRRL Y-1542]ODV72013.1 calcium-transporting P [Cyberlindnera jadinii NRRL Y-1542]